MKKTNYRKRILARLDFLRRKNPAGYAQVLLLPFGPVPSFALEDPGSEWWSSDEARSRFESLLD